jgi:branched-chain amino acid transport system substrate-binding protein
MVTPICSNPTITERGSKSVLRVVQDDVANGIAQIDFAVKVLGGKRLGILYANQDYGRGMFDVGSRRAKELGVPIVAEPYNEGETDYNAVIGRFKAAAVDMLVHMGFYTEAALQRRQALQQGVKVPFFGGPGIVSSEFIKLGGADVEGVLVLDFIKEEMVTAKLRDLATRTKEKFNEGFNFYHRNGYDAMNFVAKALESAKDRSRGAVNAALRGTEIQGLTYPIKLNDKGNLIVPMDRLNEYYALKVVRGGKFVDYKP